MKKLIGPIIFILAAAAIVLMKWYGKGTVEKLKPVEQKVISAFVGGEKLPFLNNPEVKDILLKRYGITLNAVKSGSIEMVTESQASGQDALWPSNQIAVKMFRKRGEHFLTEENMFNSPLVLYTYDVVCNALIKQKIVKEQNKSFYIIDLPKLLQFIVEGKTWQDIGLPQLYGKIAIYSTDPTRSNSGNMFAGLLASAFNQGVIVTDQTVDNVLPQLKTYFELRGYMEHSSGDIFNNFITTGVGAKPVIVGYENQIIEFSLENEKYIDYLRTKIRTLYPVPTVWSSHPIIALTPKGKSLIEAMKDKDIQRIAWEKHGFRSGLIGVENDPTVLNVAGIPKEITAVIPMPEVSVMERIFEALKGETSF